MHTDRDNLLLVHSSISITCAPLALHFWISLIIYLSLSLWVNQWQLDTQTHWQTVPTFKCLPEILVVLKDKLVHSEGVSAYQRTKVPVEDRNIQEYILVPAEPVMHVQQLMSTYLSSDKAKSTSISDFSPSEKSLPLCLLWKDPHLQIWLVPHSK